MFPEYRDLITLTDDPTEAIAVIRRYARDPAVLESPEMGGPP